MKEIWKDILGWEGCYQVSSFGNIKSSFFGKTKLLKPINGVKYMQINLSVNRVRKTYSIHQLVAQAFLDYKFGSRKIVVNHKNFIRSDNNLINLEVISQRENSNLKHIKSSSKYTGVSWHKNINKWQSRIDHNGKTKQLGYFSDEYDAHLAYEKELKEILK